MPVERSIKCVVWDLDNTLWDGRLMDGERVNPRRDAVNAIVLLDERGILHSIASRNDEAPATAKLREFGIDEYFLYPEINWGPKSRSVKRIAEALNIGLDSVAFIDDDPFERDEVACQAPDVLCLSPDVVAGMGQMAEFTPVTVSDDARNRRLMLRAESQRRHAEERFGGPAEAFMATLGLRMSLRPATREDLDRATELTSRTNQMNATGRTYSQDELAQFVEARDHLLLIAELDDKYGAYGLIGLMLIETSPSRWRIRLLLTSCRVVSRGVGSLLLTYVAGLAREQGAELQADFVDTGRNRLMNITYRLSGFRETAVEGDVQLLRRDDIPVAPWPDYVQLHSEPLSPDRDAHRR